MTQLRARNRLAACLLMFAVTACGRGAQAPQAQSAAMIDDTHFLADENVWRMQRQQDLLKPDGWTSLVGLHWLELKSHYIGSGADSGIRLAKGPEKMGLVQRDGEHLFFTPEAGVALTLDGQPLSQRVELRTDQNAAPASVIGFDEGKGLVTVIKRGDRYALRVKHADAPARKNFTGLQYWSADPSWRVDAKFVPHAAGKSLQIASIIGTLNAIPNPGAVEFQRDGKTWRLEALDEGEGLSLIFADRTSGHESYGAGRYIDASMPDAEGRVVVDFNQAYNPPCAFTPFATCPLPPPENRLDLAITAGEKAYIKAH